MGLPPSAAGLAGLPELLAAQESLQSAIAVCIRYAVQGDVELKAHGADALK